MLTAGGFAPCLSAAIGGLIERYTEIAPDVEIHRLPIRLRGPFEGRFDHCDADRSRECGGSPHLWRIADRKLARQVD
jgi:pyrophosphate--fructose-6-phosphate 1-phosphotransferase